MDDNQIDVEEIKLNIKKHYYAMIADYRPEVHAEAKEELGKYEDPAVGKLAEAAEIIYGVLYGKNGPEQLTNALQILGTLPETDYMSSFMETAGQVVIAKGLESKEPDRKTALIEKGLIMVSKATAQGIPVSKATIMLVRSAKDEEPKLAAMADQIRNMAGSLDVQESAPKKSLKTRTEGASSERRKA